jgi:uncharacterized Tic20 family protein
MTENHPQDQPAEGGQQYSGQPPPPPPPPAQAYGQQPPAYGQQPQPPYGQQPQPPYGQQAPVSPSDARMWSLFAHLGGFVSSIIVALVIYLVYKDRDPFIRRHAAQALNFQIIVGIAFVIASILTIVLIGIPLLLALGVCWILFPILAAVAANKGEDYTYPLTPAMIK